jgi:hypothetical protein
LTNGTRRKRTDGRSTYENIADILQPASFVIEIFGDEGKPVGGARFNIAVDGGSANILETDEQGIFKIVRPMHKVNMSWAS